MLQFPDISRPVIVLKALDQLVGNVADLLLKGLIVPLDKGLYKRLNILLALPQGRNRDGHDAQAVIDILSEMTAGDLVDRILVQRRDDLQI